MTKLIKSTDIILKAIHEDKDFRADFNEIAISIADKIYSYFVNPNCTCKNTIIEWINSNVEVTNNLLVKYTDLLNKFEVKVQKDNVSVKSKTNQQTPDYVAMLNNPNLWSGNVYTIDRDIVKYKEMIRKSIAEQWLYRGVTIVPDVVDGKEVWNVFFY